MELRFSFCDDNLTAEFVWQGKRLLARFVMPEVWLFSIPCGPGGKSHSPPPTPGPANKQALCTSTVREKQLSESAFLATNLRSRSLSSLTNSRGNRIINMCLILGSISQLVPNSEGKKRIVNDELKPKNIILILRKRKLGFQEDEQCAQYHQNLKYEAKLAVQARDLSLKP